MLNRFELAIVNALEKFAVRLHGNSQVALNKLRQYRFFNEFEERDDDIYVITYMKSGTTWMQMILYLMLHGNKDDFEHIYDVSPWLSNSAYLGDTAGKANSLPSPRIFKTHNRYDEFRKDVKGRFIFIMRNGPDVAASLYHHERNYKDPDATFDDVFKAYFSNPQENWFGFCAAWLANRNNFNILYLSYEQLKQDFDGTIKQVAAFLKLELSPEKTAALKHYASFEYMKSIEHKFGEKPTKESRLVFDQFIRKGESNYGQAYFSSEQLGFYNQQYLQQLSAVMEKRFSNGILSPRGKTV